MQQRCTTKRSFESPLLILLDVMDSVVIPSFQLVGPRSELLDFLSTQSWSFGLTVPSTKCEVSFGQVKTYLSQEVDHPLQFSDGAELLGSPIFGSPKYLDGSTDFLSFTSSNVYKIYYLD